MKKALMIFVIVVLALCFYLYIKNNFVSDTQKADGEFAYKGGTGFEYIKQRV